MTLPRNNLLQLSRVVSHALRHQPEAYGLCLDHKGWVAVKYLLAALRSIKKEWQHLSILDLEQMIADSEKKRHEIINGKIRALYGHSTPRKINLNSVLPPNILYHGTAPETATIILREGLSPMSRQYVHLASSKNDAEKVGKRKSELPIILIVYALKASKDGINFYQGNDKVWLSDAIPNKYIMAIENETKSDYSS